ncbi:MAG: hypothetical protein HY301_12170 [Verrucomicrobia bacterium]|nr:hypothetical protein [Verrucomicrobiota bacterium]
MEEIAHHFESMDDNGVVQYALARAAGVAAHAGDFTGISPTAAALTAEATAAGLTIGQASTANTAAQAATLVKNSAIAALKNSIRLFGSSAEEKSGHSGPKLEDAGFTLAQARTPTGELAKVTGLELDFGTQPTTLAGSMNKVPKKKSYEIWINLTPNNPAGWTFKLSTTKTKFLLEGLVSGTVVQVKARAVGGDTGYGPFSDIAEHLVP